MASFAQIDENNIVTAVIAIDDAVLDDGTGIENEQQGKDYIANELLETGTWLQTSYNHNIRGMYATVGGTYDATHDKFVPPNGRLTAEGEYEEAV